MILYHGSNVVVKEIKLEICKPFRDFGKGFYLTDIRSQAEEWALFVMNNRDRYFSDLKNPLCNQDNKYDIVHGPVANDAMAVLFQQYEQEFIDLEMLKKRMTYKELSMQYSFHTEKAVALLKKTRTIYG